ARPLTPLLPRPLAQPLLEPGQVRRLLRAPGRLVPGDVAPEGHEVQVNADEALGMVGGKPRAHERAPVAALRAEAAIAEDVGHEGSERRRDLGDAESRLPRTEREAV